MGCSSFFEGRNPSTYPSSVRSSTHSSGPKIECEGSYSMFGSEDRVLPMGGYSLFGSEDRRWGLRFSAPKNEERSGVLRRNPLRRLTPPFFELNLSSPKPGHTTGGSSRGARRGGGAESVRTGCQQNCSPRRQASLVLSKASKTRRLNDSPKARTSEILCKPVEEQNPRLTRGR